jgi:hypothetical protein
MQKSTLRILCFCFICLPGTAISLYSQDSASLSYRLLFYNTGNFFDTSDDTLTLDDDFTPDGVMRWNHTRYDQKVRSLYKVITASGGWEPPAIVGLCEVENRKVLNDLVYGTYLPRYDYSVLHFESNDPRGIDIGIIYRKNIVKLLHSEPLIPEGYDSASFHTRFVLYSKWLISDDTVHLFLNHWPSRRGGVLPGEELRKSIASMVRQRSDSITMCSGGTAGIIIAGDFNCSPDDGEMIIITGSMDNEAQGRYINISAAMSGEIPGTYKYRGAWEMIDQIIVSKPLIDKNRKVFTSAENSGVFSPDFLLRKDNSFTGVTPFSTYTGYRYSGGFSDHLPVFIDLRINR